MAQVVMMIFQWDQSTNPEFFVSPGFDLTSPILDNGLSKKLASHHWGKGGRHNLLLFWKRQYNHLYVYLMDRNRIKTCSLSYCHSLKIVKKIKSCLINLVKLKHILYLIFLLRSNHTISILCLFLSL